MITGREETVEKIQQAALREFYEKGYLKASLRNICSRAGVTTGALYFSFENKEALFRSILEPLVEKYKSMIAELLAQEIADRSGNADLDAMLMKFILEHRMETIIIMERAQGSCYEGFRQLVEGMMEQSFRSYYQSRLETEPDPGLMKLLAKQRLDSCIAIVKEDYDMEYSLYLVRQIGIHAEGGTEKLIQSLSELHSS